MTLFGTDDRDSAGARADEAGWEGVVTRLVAERGDSLTRYARLLCGNDDDAADLVQDALVKTFGRLRNGFSIASAEAYVRKAILNNYLDRGRRTSLWRRIRHLTVMTDLQNSPADELDERIDLAAQLRTLSPRERACVVLRYYEDLKVDDIAAELDLSAGTIKRYLSDALAKLAISLSDDDQTPGVNFANRT